MPSPFSPAFAGELVTLVREFMARQLGAFGERIDVLAKRMDTLETREQIPGPRGEKGDTGERGERGEKGEQGEIGPSGDRGDKGDSGDVGPRGEVGMRGEVGPVGQQGEKGDVGEKGEKGDTGGAGPQGEKGDRGERGEQGPQGAAGETGPQGEQGPVGPAGVDGKSVTLDDVRPWMEAEIAKWALDFERRAADTMQRAIDKIPVPKDGVDGLSIEDMQVEHDGDGLVTITFKRGEIERSFQIRLPRFKERGVYRATETYRQGDGVSYGGSFFIAQKDDPVGKPEAANADWRMAVKRGRDGTDGKNGDRGPPGPKGEPGKDMTYKGM